MTVESQIFATVSEATAGAPKEFGVRYRGRYHMPTLPGEATVKALPKGAAPWVPSGVMSVTNMLDGFEESRGLNIWEQEQFAIGLAMQPSMYGELCLKLHEWQREGVDFSRLRDFPHVRAALTGGADQKAAEVSFVGRAKQTAGANEARQAGTNYHTAWEVRAKTGELVGTPEMQAGVLSMERLLAENGLVRVPGLSERVVRNMVVRTTGKFDDILLSLITGRLLMADLKTKKRAFRTWQTVDGQLATYARSEWMLSEPHSAGQYEQGPLHHVDLTEGVVLQLPSDGSPPYLRRADLVEGWEVAQLARRVHDRRSFGKSAERMAMSEWREIPTKDLAISS